MRSVWLISQLVALIPKWRRQLLSVAAATVFDLVAPASAVRLSGINDSSLFINWIWPALWCSIILALLVGAIIAARRLNRLPRWIADHAVLGTHAGVWGALVLGKLSGLLVLNHMAYFA